MRVGLPCVIFFACLALSSIGHLALHVPELIGCAAVTTVVLAAAVFTVEKAGLQWSATFILVFAGILRGLFLFQSPELSDDIFRYVFDGMMLLNGANPYAEPPARVVTSDPAILALIPLVNHAELPTIYPPAAQAAFAAGAFLGGPLGMKLLLAAMDLCSCLLIIRILKRLELPPSRAVLYAWHPLPVIEITASGHIDAAAVCFLLLALHLALCGARAARPVGVAVTARRVRRKESVLSLAAGVCFMIAVLVKWIPLLFLPGVFLLVNRHCQAYWVAGCAMTWALFTAPFWPEIQNGYSTLSVYLVHWEFSGFAFRTLREISGSGATARIILGVGGIAAVGGIYFRLLSSDFFQARRFDALVFRSFYAASFVWLLLTPTLHPWYALYLVCFLPFAPGPAGLVLSWSALLAYRVLIPYHLTGNWIENDATALWIAAAPGVAWLAHQLLKNSIYRQQNIDINDLPNRKRLLYIPSLLEKGPWSFFQSEHRERIRNKKGNYEQ